LYKYIHFTEVLPPESLTPLFHPTLNFLIYEENFFSFFISVGTLALSNLPPQAAEGKNLRNHGVWEGSIAYMLLRGLILKT
jgi:hypothetical protein